MYYLLWRHIECAYAGKTYSKKYLTKEVVPISDYEWLEDLV